MSRVLSPALLSSETVRGVGVPSANKSFPVLRAQEVNTLAGGGRPHAVLHVDADPARAQPGAATQEGLQAAAAEADEALLGHEGRPDAGGQGGRGAQDQRGTDICRRCVITCVIFFSPKVA